MSEAPRGFHDLGGLEEGPIDRTEHAPDFWELRVDALMRSLSSIQHNGAPIVRVDELRRGIEALGTDAYDKMSYYERWITSISNILLERGVISVEELGRKLAEIEAREP